MKPYSGMAAMPYLWAILARFSVHFRKLLVGLTGRNFGTWIGDQLVRVVCKGLHTL